VPIRSLGGAPTLLLFWNPSCGFCQQMERDIAAWVAQPPEGSPQVVAVLTNPDAHPEIPVQGMTTLADVDGRVSSAFGARGTPMGVLLDAETRVASETAAGEQAVFALLRSAAREMSA
jgi:thiol-disulfide isomerase/thioredoxin